MSSLQINRAFQLFVTCALLASAPATLIAQTVPADPEAVPRAPTLRRVEKALANAHRVRVVTHGGALILNGVHVDEQGVQYAEILERGDADSLVAPGVLPWSRVLRIDRYTDPTQAGLRRTAILGGVTLGVAGIFMASGANEAAATIALSGVIGTGYGVVASATTDRVLTPSSRLWKRVYPDERDLKRR